MQSKDFAIGVLATTAAILLVGLALVQTSPRPAYADGMTTSAGTGNYILTVGAFNLADEEFVYLVDTATDRMVVYRFDSGRRQIDLVQGMDLAELHRAGAPAAAPGAPAPPRRSNQPTNRP